MDRDSLLELLSKEDVIALMEELGSDWYKEENNNTLIFESICHTNKGKNIKLNAVSMERK